MNISSWNNLIDGGLVLNTSLSNISTFVDYERYYPLWFEIPLWLLMIGLSIETILGNALVVLAYNLDRGIQKHFSNQYIVSLAISDMIIGLEGFPLLTLYVVHGERWTMGGTICQIWLFLDYAMCLVSILTVLLITVDRYGSVCYPARYLKWQSPDKVKILIGISWVLPCLLFGLMIFGWTAFTGETVTEPYKCYAPFLNDPYVNMSMYIIYYWTTLIAMLILYRGIHKTARNLERKAQAREKNVLALMIGQTCFAKVGVGLLLHDGGQDEGTRIEGDSGTVILDAINVDSGYTTAATTGRMTNCIEGLTIAEVTEIPEDPPNPIEQPKDDHSEKPPVQAPIIHRALSARHRRSKYMQQQHDSGASMEVYDDSNSLLSRGFGDLSLTSLLTLAYDKQSLRETPIGANQVRVHRRRSTLRKDSNTKSGATSPASSPTRMNGTCRPAVESIVVDSPTSIDLVSSVPSQIQAAHGTPKKIHFHSHSRRESLNSCEGEKGQLNQQGPSQSKFKTWRMATFRKRRRSSVRRVSVESSEEDSLSEEDSDESTPPSPKLTTIAEDQSYHTTKETDTSTSLNPPKSATTKTHHRLTVARKEGRQEEPPINITKRRRNALAVFLDTTGAMLKRRRKKNKAERKARKAFRTITIIVGFFALFWSPYYITATIYGFCSECVPSAIFLISYYMCYLNSSGNPFAYALANRQFRVAFLRMLRGDFSPHH